jgi:hypothetical protein
MSYKGSRSRIQNHQAAREAWERVFGKNRTGEPPRANQDAKAMSVSDPSKPNERADETNLSPTNDLAQTRRAGD